MIDILIECRSQIIEYNTYYIYYTFSRIIKANISIRFVFIGLKRDRDCQ